MERAHFRYGAYLRRAVAMIDIPIKAQVFALPPMQNQNG
jgi:hypothetical protein